MKFKVAGLNRFKRFFAVTFLVLFLTVSPYVVGYVYVHANPDLFLTEISIPVSQTSSQIASGAGSGKVVQNVGVGATVKPVVVVRYSWFNGIHERFVSAQVLLFASLGLCSFYKPLKRKTSLVRKGFFTYGVFVALWLTSLAFTQMHKFDEVLNIVVFGAGMFLLFATGIAMTAKTLGSRNKGKRLRESIHKWGYLFGVFVAVWFVSVSIIAFEITVPLFAFALAGTATTFFVVTVLSSQIKELRNKLGR